MIQKVVKICVKSNCVVYFVWFRLFVLLKWTHEFKIGSTRLLFVGLCQTFNCWFIPAARHHHHKAREEALGSQCLYFVVDVDLLVVVLVLDWVETGIWLRQTESIYVRESLTGQLLLEEFHHSFPFVSSRRAALVCLLSSCVWVCVLYTRKMLLAEFGGQFSYPSRVLLAS